MAKVEELTAAEAQLEWDTPLFRTALTQFEQAIPHADVTESILERLRYPERAVMVAVPIRRDAGHYEVFPTYRVQHSSVLGPTKGGIRYDPHVTLGNVLQRLLQKSPTARRWGQCSTPVHNLCRQDS